MRTLKRAIQDAGWKVGTYTGQDKRGGDDGLSRFLKGELDILIASKTISTGIDGLQNVCHRIVMNELPWTSADFDQIKGRIWRSGQSDPVEIVVMIAEGTQRTGDRWSMDRNRMNRIQYKRGIADAVLDGTYPEANLISPNKAFRLLGEWLKDLDEGKVTTTVMRKVEIPFVPSNEEERRMEREHGDVSKMNRLWGRMPSAELHEMLAKDSRPWEIYHTARSKEMAKWQVNPVEELSAWCKKRSGRVVGDFGCGEAYLAKELNGYCKVHSFDHVAIHDDVVACDMAHTPLEDDTLDIAIFSLSLWGPNWEEYLAEAYRTLRIDGFLWIVEPSISKKIHGPGKMDIFQKVLQEKGFSRIEVTTEGQFTSISCVKE